MKIQGSEQLSDLHKTMAQLVVVEEGESQARLSLWLGSKHSLGQNLVMSPGPWTSWLPLPLRSSGESKLWTTERYSASLAV